MALTIEDITNSTYWNGSAFVSGSRSVTATGGSSWTYPLAASALTVGNSYTVTASATDSAGNNSMSSPMVTFNYDNTAPTVAVSSPVNGTTYGANWSGSLTATASANAGGADITGVGVSIQQGSGGCWTGSGNTWTATCPNYVAATYSSGTWNLTLPASDLTSGDTYTVTAQATDTAGNTNTATSTFTYSATAPTVAVAYPVNSTTYGANWSGTLSGSASAANGASISSVSVAAEDITSGKWWNGTSFSAGSETFESATGTTVVDLSLGGLDPDVWEYRTAWWPRPPTRPATPTRPPTASPTTPRCHR